MTGVDRDRLIIHVPVPITDPHTAVPLIASVDRLLRGIRTAVCTGWLGDDSGEPRPYLTAWLDLDCALVLTHLAPDHAVLELHLSARPATGQSDAQPGAGRPDAQPGAGRPDGRSAAGPGAATYPGQPCCRTAD